MKARIFIILCWLFYMTCAFGQTDNTLYVKQFAGTTVGAKLTAAMQACNPDSSIACILVLDPSLSKWPVGVMPSLCSQCSLVDYRGGVPSGYVVANVHMTGQANSISGVVFYTVPVDGFYRLTVAVATTTAGTAGTVVANVYWGAGAQLITPGASLDLTTVLTPRGASGAVWLSAGTTISRNTVVTGATGAPQYRFDALVERIQ